MTKYEKHKSSKIVAKAQKHAQLNRAFMAFVEGVEIATGARISLTPSETSNPLLSAEQAADYLNVAAKTLANWRSIGSGPEYRKIGGRCLYPQAALIAFVEKRKVSSTSQYRSMSTEVVGMNND